MNTTTASTEVSGSPAGGDTQPQQLYRPLENRMIAGVAAGVARYLGVDVAVVRIVLAVLAVAGGAGVPVYLLGWLLIPEEGSVQSIASEFFRSLQARPR